MPYTTVCTEEEKTTETVPYTKTGETTQYYTSTQVIPKVCSSKNILDLTR